MARGSRIYGASFISQFDCRSNVSAGAVLAPFPPGTWERSGLGRVPRFARAIEPPPPGVVTSTFNETSRTCLGDLSSPPSHVAAHRFKVRFYILGSHTKTPSIILF